MGQAAKNERDSTARPPKLRGYNHNFKYRGTMFHIQTEDYGYPRCYFCSHVFVSGQVVRSVRTKYPEQGERPHSEEELSRVMLAAHQSLFKMLKSGEFDDFMEAAPANDRPVAANEAGPTKPKEKVSRPKTPASPSVEKTKQSARAQAADPKKLAPPVVSKSNPSIPSKPNPAPTPQAAEKPAQQGPIRLSWPPQESAPAASSAQQQASAPRSPVKPPSTKISASPPSVPTAPAGVKGPFKLPPLGPAKKPSATKLPVQEAPSKPVKSPAKATIKPLPNKKAPAPQASRSALSLSTVASESLKGLSRGIKGLLAVAYFDTTTLKPLFVSDEGLSLKQSLDALAEFCFALQSGCEAVSPGQGHFEVVSQTQDHFLIMIQITGSTQLFLAISRKLGNLAMARYTLAPVAETLREHPPKRG